MHDLKITVARFAQYPLPQPTSYVVGFSAEHVPSGRTVYRDTLIDFSGLSPEHTDDDVVSAAWLALEGTIESWSQCCSPHGVIGSVFVPPTASVGVEVGVEGPTGLETIVEEPAPAAVDEESPPVVEEPAPAPVVDEEPAPAPVVDEEPAPAAVDEEPAPAPVVEEEPAPVVADDPAP